MQSRPLNQYEEGGILHPEQICLNVGSPGPDLLHLVAGYIEKGAIALTKKYRHEETLQYSPLRGSYLVREELAKFLTRQYGQKVDKNDLFITCGATAGIQLLIDVFMDGDRIVFVENPTYMIFARHLRKSGKVPLSHVNMEQDGIDLDDLEKQVQGLPKLELTPEKPFRALVYVISTHHNPTGCCYSEVKSRRLISLARKHKLLVVCDDVYNTLNYQVDPTEPEKFLFSSQRLFAYDDKNDLDYEGNVVSNGSFSKIAAPSLRLGWFEIPDHVAKRLEDTFLVESGSGMSAFISSIMGEVLASGDMDGHLQYLRKVYKKRMETTISTIEKRVGGLGVKIRPPKGGVFIWIQLPQGVDAAHVLQLAWKSKVRFLCGETTSVVGDFKNFIRVSISFYPLRQLLLGVECLCTAIQKLATKQVTL